MLLSSDPLTFGTVDSFCVYTETVERRCDRVFRKGGSFVLGIFAVALGAGILITAIFPVGALLFLVAFLLIACGCACCRR